MRTLLEYGRKREAANTSDEMLFGDQFLSRPSDRAARVQFGGKL